MAAKRTPRPKPAFWRRKTVRATTTKAKNRKDTLRGKRKATSPLSKADIERFERMLFEKRSDLVGDMNGMRAEVLPDNHNRGNSHPSSLPVHYSDLSSDSYEREFTLHLLANERVLLEEIDSSLKLIKEGKYGMCQATGKPIRKARLTAKPWAKYCIEYARMKEKGIGQLNGAKETRSWPT